MPIDVDVAPFTGAPDQLSALVGRWPFKPHRWGHEREGGDLTALASERLAARLRAPGAAGWEARVSGRTAGLAILQPLAWDSRWLGMPAARLDIVAVPEGRGHAVPSALIAAALGMARQDQLTHVTARVDAADHGAVQALEGAGFISVDTLLTFGARIEDVARAAMPAGVELRGAIAGDGDAIGEIAAEAFRAGRFHADGAIAPERARDIYRAWAAGCVNGSAADAVIVAVEGGEPIGFVACRVAPDTAVHLGRLIGTIELISTSARSRGRQVGSALVGGAAAWFENRGVTQVEVGTQLSNIGASRLYERCGFRLVAGSLTLRAIISS